jgi:excisionase family DNA binding protein
MTQPKGASPPRYVGLQRVADEWDVSYRTIWNLVRDGRLPAIRVGSRWRVSADLLDVGSDQLSA